MAFEDKALVFDESRWGIRIVFRRVTNVIKGDPGRT